MSDLSDRSRLLALAALPDELKALRQWVVWRYEARPGKDKPAKRPYQPAHGAASAHGCPGDLGHLAAGPRPLPAWRLAGPGLCLHCC